MSQKTVEINGTLYDKHTGMPIRNVQPSTPTKHRSHAGSLHRTPQKSTTLHRSYVRKTESATTSAQQPKASTAIEHKPDKRDTTTTVRTTRKAPSTPAQRSEHITKYAKHPAAARSTAKRSAAQDIIAGPAVHPMVQHVEASRAAKQKQPAKTHKPSDVIKKEAVEKALHDAPAHHRAPHRDKQKTRSRRSLRRARRAAAAGLPPSSCAPFRDRAPCPAGC